MTCEENIMPKREAYVIPEKPTLEYENQLWGEGFRVVAGLDEAGRGAWAGPVFAAAVVLPTDNHVIDLLNGVRDSKCMTAKQREHWRGCIQSASVTWTIGSASHLEVDEIGIVPATCLAMQRALDDLLYEPNYLLVDYIQIRDCSCPQLSLPKGDCRSLSIAAASVLAKTERDEYMTKLDKQFPGYGFAQHKGYGTAQHRLAIEKLGPCIVHRRSFKPIKGFFST
jgi:ribonuclease HII